MPPPPPTPPHPHPPPQKKNKQTNKQTKTKQKTQTQNTTNKQQTSKKPNPPTNKQTSKGNKLTDKQTNKQTSKQKRPHQQNHHNNNSTPKHNFDQVEVKAVHLDSTRLVSMAIYDSKFFEFTPEALLPILLSFLLQMVGSWKRWGSTEIYLNSVGGLSHTELRSLPKAGRLSRSTTITRLRPTLKVKDSSGASHSEVCRQSCAWPHGAPRMLL